jgi:hypothetical protein
MALDLPAVDIYRFLRVGVLGVGATRLVLCINSAAELPVRIVWDAPKTRLPRKSAHKSGPTKSHTKTGYENILAVWASCWQLPR